MPIRSSILAQLLVAILSGAAAPQLRAENTSIVSVLIPLSGQYAPLGEDCKAGLQAAKAFYGEIPETSLIYGDTQAEGKVAITEFRAQMNRQTPMAVIALRAPACKTLGPATAAEGIPLFCSTGVPDFTDQVPNAIQIWPTATLEGGALVRALRQRGIKTVAMLTQEDEWMTAFSRGIHQAASDEDLEFVFDEAGVLDAEALKLLALRIVKLAPEAVIANLSIQMLGPFFRYLRAQGYKGEMYSTFWAGKEAVIKDAGKAIENVRFVEVSLNLPKFRELLSQLALPRPSALTFACFASYGGVQQLRRKGLEEIGRIPLPDAELRIQNRQMMFPIAEKVIDIKGEVRELSVISLRAEH